MIDLGLSVRGLFASTTRGLSVLLRFEPLSFLPSSSTWSYQTDLSICSAIYTFPGDEHVSRHIEMRDGDVHFHVFCATLTLLFAEACHGSDARHLELQVANRSILPLL